MPSARPVRAAAARRALAVLLLALPLSGCNQILHPCDADSFKSDRRDPGLLDGSWKLHTIDNRDIPVGGYNLPLGAGRLIRGELNFYTFAIEEGSCDEIEKTSGEVIALYEMRKPDGTLDRVRTQVGSFEYDRDTGRVLLRALGQSAPATVMEDINRITLVAPIPLPVLGTVSYTLLFSR